MMHGVGLHTDQSEAAPWDIIGLAVSANPTLVLPHKTSLNIIGNSIFAPVLDYKLDDPKLFDKMADFNRVLLDQKSSVSPAVLRLREKIREAMVETSVHSLNLMTGMDIHIPAAQMAPRRVCAKIVSNFDRSCGNWQLPEV